jgi:hypothetical protein
MKKTITLLAIFYIVNVFATDRFVDPNLSQGNGTTLFTTITSAVAAAVNGDRIIVTSSTYNESDLTISKSLQIIPQISGTTINFNADIFIDGFASMNLEIIGFNLGIYSFRFNSTNASNNNRAKVSIIECSAKYIYNYYSFYESIIIGNTITEGISFSYGNIINNNTKQISLFDEPGDNNFEENFNKIIGNQVGYLIGVYNNNYPTIIANNSLRDLSFRRWNANEDIVNYIVNNEFTSNDSVLHFSTTNVPFYNIKFSNNNFIGGRFLMVNQGSSDLDAVLTKGYTISSPSASTWLSFNYNNWMPSWSWCCNGPNGWYYINGEDNPTKPSNHYSFYRWWENGSDDYLNTSVPGFFEFSYNGIESTMNIPNSGSPLNFTNIQGPVNSIDGGNPNHRYYDIDLTINDRGVNGGPYSRQNYNAYNPNNSRAFIFDLEMPVDLFPGQDIQIKAKGYHKN